VIIVSAEIETLPGGLPSFVIGAIQKPYDVSPLLKLVKQYTQPV